MEGFAPIFFLAVVLKIPVGLLLYLVWWALRQQPEVDEAPGDGEHDFKRWQRQPHDPRHPRRPRRGPGAPDARPLPACPPGGRSRSFTPPVPLRSGRAGAAQLAER